MAHRQVSALKSTEDAEARDKSPGAGKHALSIDRELEAYRIYSNAAESGKGTIRVRRSGHWVRLIVQGLG